MKFTKLMVGLLSASVLFCGCIKDNSAAIKVNDKVITKSQFYDGFKALKETQLKNVSKNLKGDDSFLVLSLKGKYVNDVIFRELLNQEFEKRKIEATNEEIEAKKQEVIKQLGSEEKFKTLLKDNGISDAKLKEDLENEVKTIKLVNTLNVPKVSEKDAQKFYNNNKEQFNMPESVQVSHILIDTNIDSIKRKIVSADKDAKLTSEEINAKAKEEVAKKQELLKKVLSEVKADKNNFAKYAKEYSEDEASAKESGSLGYITKGQMVPEFEKAAFSLKVGEISQPVKTQYGEHIILVTDKSAGGMQSFENVKNELILYLDKQNKINALQEYATSLKDKATIEFVDETLKPDNIQKQISEAIQKQIAGQQKSTQAPKETDSTKK